MASVASGNLPRSLEGVRSVPVPVGGLRPVPGPVEGFQHVPVPVDGHHHGGVLVINEAGNKLQAIYLCNLLHENLAVTFLPFRIIYL